MPDTPPSEDPLLTTNLLVFEQTASSAANDVGIVGPDGESLGAVQSKDTRN